MSYFSQWYSRFKLSPRPVHSAEIDDFFHKVQTSGIFADSKTFVDSVPRKPLYEIKRIYQSNPSYAQDLERFITEHFELPEHIAAPKRPEEYAPTLREYIGDTWKNLTRGPDAPKHGSSSLVLPRPYITPGGRFRELYYWDTYFIMVGLRENGEITMIENMIENLAHLIRTYGLIPNSSHTYHLSRSQPPFFALMIQLLANIRGERIYTDYLPDMLREYDYWMRGAQSISFRLHLSHASEHVMRMPDGSILNRYYDDLAAPREESYREDLELLANSPDPQRAYRSMRAAAESGWDFSSRWCATGDNLGTVRTLDVVPVDLNCVLYETENIIARACELANDTERAAAFRSRANARKQTILKYCWNDERGFFFDYVRGEKPADKHLTLAGVFPLYVGIASPEQAAKVTQVLSKDFLRTGGLLTTTTYTMQQWDAPNGWAPLQYIATEGLERYGYSAHAEDIARRWCAVVHYHFERHKTIFEKYDVEHTAMIAGGGEYKVQEGFGWTNGVVLYFMNKYGIEF